MPPRAFLGRVSDVDLRLLRVFRAVVACGGVSAAELELNIGRSTISRHLTDLELRLGVKLCDRGPAGFALTAEGEQVLEASSRLMSAINSFNTRVNGYTDDYEKTKGSGIIVITSGMPRKPGMSRDDLIKTNALIIKEVAGKAMQNSPDAIIIMVTNPLDVMTYAAL